MRAAVNAALGPVHNRLDELERTLLETIVRIAASSPTQAPVQAPSPVAAPASHTAPRLTEAIFELPESALLPPPLPGDVTWEYPVQSSERRRWQIIAAIAGFLLFATGTFLGMVSSGH
jgi:hypothetical protein